MSSIYRNIGGDSVLREVVDRFYRKVLADGRLAGYFDGTDMAKLKSDQVRVFGAALGGEGIANVVGSQVQRMRGIDHEDFDLVVCYLADALHATGVPHGVISEILFTLAPLARDIVTVPDPRRGEDSPPAPEDIAARRRFPEFSRSGLG